MGEFFPLIFFLSVTRLSISELAGIIGIVSESGPFNRKVNLILTGSYHVAPDFLESFWNPDRKFHLKLPSSRVRTLIWEGRHLVFWIMPRKVHRCSNSPSAQFVFWLTEWLWVDHLSVPWFPHLWHGDRDFGLPQHCEDGSESKWFLSPMSLEPQVQLP